MHDNDLMVPAADYAKAVEIDHDLERTKERLREAERLLDRCTGFIEVLCQGSATAQRLAAEVRAFLEAS